MILTPHIITGAVLGGRTSNYFFAAIAGFFSHYLLDTIPHSQYGASELEKLSLTHEVKFRESPLWHDLARVAIDIAIGFMSVFLIVYVSKTVPVGLAIVGGIFGMMPDALQFLYWITPQSWKPVYRLLKVHYNFHYWVHTKTKVGPILGAATQIVAVATMFLIVIFLK